MDDGRILAETGIIHRQEDGTAGVDLRWSAIPGASLTKSRQEKANERKTLECLHGFVRTRGVRDERSTFGRAGDRSERETGDVLVCCRLAVSAGALGRCGED